MELGRFVTPKVQARLVIHLQRLIPMRYKSGEGVKIRQLISARKTVFPEENAASAAIFCCSTLVPVGVSKLIPDGIAASRGSFPRNKVHRQTRTQIPAHYYWSRRNLGSYIMIRRIFISPKLHTY
jgi:hypothetical protein